VPIFNRADSDFFNENYLYRKMQTRVFYDKYYDLLSETYAAVFYTDPYLSIIVQKGNTKLLKQLNQLNIGIGSNLQERIIGTNAAALCFLNHKDSYVIGAEHYIEALQDYATVAIKKSNSLDDSLQGYTVFITTKDRYNEYQLPMISYLNDLGKYYLNSKWNYEISIMSELLYENMQQSRGLVFIDKEGMVIKTNPWFDMNINAESCNQKLSQALPELTETLNCMETKKPLPLNQVPINIQGKKVNMFIESRPILKSGDCIGMIITLYNKKTIHNNPIQMANFHSYYSFDDLIGINPRFVSTKQSAMKAAQSLSNVLIVGESGTGKELFAHAIHNASNRSNNPFIAVNCAAIPKELIASELFGYSDGAYTGAHKGGAPGKFELANNGTLFLDEIGEMPYDMQTVFLRILEERCVTRIGGNRPVPINVRIIAATNKDLNQCIASKQFRLDLYYRLNVMRINIPPLRERIDDIPLLVDYMLNQFNQLMDIDIQGISSEVMELLKSYSWNGNVRELRNVIESSMNLCDSNIITINDLPGEICQSAPLALNSSATFEEKLIEKYKKRKDELKYINNLLEKYHGNKTKVAKEMGISRMTLYKKLEQ
jgi:Transcriptional regulator containing PAS, AAA-type ATPase, and DNA-binding domains